MQSPSLTEPLSVEDEVLKISVRDPHNVREGRNSFVAYNVITKTNLTFFKKKRFRVSRRFGDFHNLHDGMVERHLHLGRIVPPAPEKSVVGTTKVKVSKDEPVSSDDLIEKRRAALERYLNRTASHPVLRMDPDFRNFLENDSELPKATTALSGVGVLGFINRVGDTVNKMTFKMDESDPWFKETLNQIENLEQQLRKLHTSTEALAHRRKELSHSTLSFSESIQMLSNCEEHTALSRALQQLGYLEKKIGQIQSNQASCDFYTLSELAKDYINLIAAVKGAFNQREKRYQIWQNAQQTLSKKREQKAKLEVAGKTAKVVMQASKEVSAWEAKVSKKQKKFENISETIRKEFENFERKRIIDFVKTAVEYLEQLSEAQEQITRCWESFLPVAKSIA